MGFDEIFTSPGGPYFGPVLSDVMKSIKEACMGSLANKRKTRKGDSEQGACTMYKRKKRTTGGEENVVGTDQTLQREDKVFDLNDGSGMAVAGEQPCRPQ